MDIIIYNSNVLNYQFCERVFYTALVRFNGHISDCCVDILGQLNIGDVSKESSQQILNGEQLCKIRKTHNSGNLSTLLQCLYCDFRNPLGLDSYRKEIVGLF